MCGCGEAVGGRAHGVKSSLRSRQEGGRQKALWESVLKLVSTLQSAFSPSLLAQSLLSCTMHKLTKIGVYLVSLNRSHVRVGLALVARNRGPNAPLPFRLGDTFPESSVWSSVFPFVAFKPLENTQ